MFMFKFVFVVIVGEVNIVTWQKCQCNADILIQSIPYICQYVCVRNENVQFEFLNSNS